MYIMDKEIFSMVKIKMLLIIIFLHINKATKITFVYMKYTDMFN